MMCKTAICFLLVFLIVSCSKPKHFLVKSVIDSQTIELEDGTVVILIGVNKTTSRYIEALKELENNYVYLYDENYDPIKLIYQGSIYAYVYNSQNICINDLSEGIHTSQVNKNEISSSSPIRTQNDNGIERISGSAATSLPTNTLSELYERNKLAVFLIAVPHSETEFAQGTGFFISSGGIGVSNYHVFEDGIKDEAIIKTIDNYQYSLKRIISYDKDFDFIIFEVNNIHRDFPYLTISKRHTGVGEDVFAIGNPRGLEHTLSRGIVSSYRENEKYIQITAEITHGSSGGPLFNMQGEVIGITTSGVGEANLNFAINIRKLKISQD